MRMLKKILSNSSGMGMLEVVLASGAVAGIGLLVASQLKEMQTGQMHMNLANDQIEMQRIIRAVLSNPTLCTAAMSGAPFDPGLSVNPVIPNFTLSGKPFSSLAVGGLTGDTVKLKPILGHSSDKWSIAAFVRTKNLKEKNLKPFVVSFSAKVDPDTKKVINCLSEVASVSETDVEVHPLPNCEPNEIIQPKTTGGWGCFPMGSFISDSSNSSNATNVTSLTNLVTSANNVIQPPANPGPPVITNPPSENLNIESAGKSCEGNASGGEADSNTTSLPAVSCQVTSYNPSALPKWYTKSPLPTNLMRKPIMTSNAAHGVTVFFEASSIGVSYESTVAFTEEVSYCSNPLDVRSCIKGRYQVYTGNLNQCRGTATCNDGEWFVNYCECNWEARISEEPIR